MAGSTDGKKRSGDPATTAAKRGRAKAAGDSKHPYHHGDLRSALLATARDCLAEKGPSGLSFREVARRAGVSHTAPYHHFVDKEALLAALATEAFAALTQEMTVAIQSLEEEHADAEDPFRRLVAIGRGYVRYALKDPEAFKLMWERDLIDIHKFADLCRNADAAYNVLTEHVVGVHAATHAPSIPTDLDILLIWSVVHGLSSLFIVKSVGIPEDQIEGAVHAALERSMGIFVNPDDPRLPHDAAVAPPPPAKSPIPE